MRSEQADLRETEQCHNLKHSFLSSDATCAGAECDGTAASAGPGLLLAAACQAPPWSEVAAAPEAL